ncbi:MAG: hypothetical protein JWP37_1370 [Mucilaginibacter sp.]|nr:hypothetical protein [Mucilaginibacter sp.]
MSYYTACKSYENKGFQHYRIGFKSIRFIYHN